VAATAPAVLHVGLDFPKDSEYHRLSSPQKLQVMRTFQQQIRDARLPFHRFLDRWKRGMRIALDDQGMVPPQRLRGFLQRQLDALNLQMPGGETFELTQTSGWGLFYKIEYGEMKCCNCWNLVYHQQGKPGARWTLSAVTQLVTTGPDGRQVTRPFLIECKPFLALDVQLPG
jgi:hypothetical protein